jgi:hypothetical protein
MRREAEVKHDTEEHVAVNHIADTGDVNVHGVYVPSPSILQRSNQHLESLCRASVRPEAILFSCR